MRCWPRRAPCWGCRRSMAGLNLKTLIGPKAGSFPALTELINVMGGNVGITDAAGKVLLGAGVGATSLPITLDGITLGWVTGSPQAAASVSSLVNHLAHNQHERRALSAEVLHLYREVHLIEQL